jgi:Ni,Fe-hydrogenase I small subunit
MTDDKPKFTPGPWEAAVTKVYAGEHCIPLVEQNWWDSPQEFKEAQANAALIAQCPNMIEFICDIVSACDYGTETLSEQFRKRGEEIIRKVYGTEGNND